MSDTKEEVKKVDDLQLQPLILFNTVDPAVLVVEKQIICSIPKPGYIPIALLAAYYVFDIEYIEGSHNMFTALEIMLLDKVPAKVPSKVGIILSAATLTLLYICILLASYTMRLSVTMPNIKLFLIILSYYLIYC